MSKPNARDSAARSRPPYGRYLAEALIVFLGVTAAFMLDGWRQEREAEVRADRFRDALVHELRTIHGTASGAVEDLKAYRKAYEDSLAAGRPLRPEPIYYVNRESPRLFEAALSAGGVEALDPQLLRKLGEFYSNLSNVFRILESMVDHSRALLIPNLDAPLDEFYDLEARTIRPKYAWMPQGRDRVIRLGQDIVARGDSLLAELQR